MQGLADGYFVIPYTIGDYFASNKFEKIDTNHAEFENGLKASKDKFNRLLNINGKNSVDSFHKRLGKVMWDKVGMARNEKGLKEAISEIKNIREEFYKDLKVTGSSEGVNTELEKAGRVADFLELGELMALDALNRPESCGGHFREESQTEEGEAKRDDENFCHVAAWEYQGENGTPTRHIEELKFEFVKLTQRSYK
jgi:succinate dehydrogenase / fumarate reductase flavoprotein subunit